MTSPRRCAWETLVPLCLLGSVSTAVGIGGSMGCNGTDDSAGTGGTGTGTGASTGTGAYGGIGGGSGGAEPPLPSVPIEQIRQLPAPVFKQGHTLPPLTYASCTWTSADGVAFETELVEKYGYAYSLHRAETYWNEQLDNPASDVAQKVQRNAADPSRYKLSTSVVRPLWVWEEGRPLPYADYLATDLPSRCSGCSPPLLTADSTVPDDVVFSPAADPAFYDLVGEDTAAPLAIYRARSIPLAVVLNLGEVGVGLSQGNCFNHRWDSDPAIMADADAVLGVSPLPACDTEGWARYASNRIARLQQRVTDKVMAELSGGSVYLYYRTEGNLNRERYGSWYDYAPWYEDTKLNSTLPNMSAYYAGDEPPYLHWTDSAWDPNTDMLTGTLASIAWQIRAGSPLSYNWVGGGWPTATHPEVSPPDLYMGYLKALYLAGNIGAVAAWWAPGLWQDAAGEWSCDPTVELLGGGVVPDGLAQLLALGEVHALFSHFEDFLRQGTLVPGPGIQRWVVGHPIADQVPAYELVCDSVTKLCDRTRRVLARKHDTLDEWIVVAWAPDGIDGEVSVDLPEAGPITVQCRAAGSLYHVTGGSNPPAIELVDVDPMHPTALLIP